MIAPKYHVYFMLDQNKYICKSGEYTPVDFRPYLQDLNYTRRMTKKGADEINFTANDKILDEKVSGLVYGANIAISSIADILKPLSLNCQIMRENPDGTTQEVACGFLATMPSYRPKGTSADLAFKFDGYLNLWEGILIYGNSNLPYGEINQKINSFANNYIQNVAQARAVAAGKSLSMTAGISTGTWINILQSFDSYKTLKEFICERCDNTTGQGPFNVYWDIFDQHGALYRRYTFATDDTFGITRSDWSAHYPADIDQTSATQISAGEVAGFASCILAVGNGETSSDSDVNTAILDREVDSSAVSDYGYWESIYQNSSISTPSVLKIHALTELSNASNPVWQPKIKLTGRQVEPRPGAGNKRIWLGDTITIQNDEDITGMTSGQFRVSELRVDISSTNAETIMPTLDGR